VHAEFGTISAEMRGDAGLPALCLVLLPLTSNDFLMFGVIK
jgi:hypothetical protein